MPLPIVIHAMSRSGSRSCAVVGALLLALGGCARPRIPLDPQPMSTPASPVGRSSARVPAPPPHADGGASDPIALATIANAGGSDAGAASADADFAYLRSRHLLIPVAGIGADRLTDSFDDARDGARRHRAIDILAPRGTPVLAADSGSIIRMSWNSAGGNTIYAVDEAHRIVYYYAHLDHYRDGLAAGARVARGDTLGFVGTTGNAPKDVPHLHFQIMRLTPGTKYWNGEALDPYELLR